MNKNLTEIVLVVDRSGSMSACQEEAENGVNTFIKEQKKIEGEANLTLVEFDSEYDFVCKGTPIKKAKKYKLQPRGMTALLDAVGRAIDETGVRLSELDEEDRPGLVVFVVLTDGQENSSKEYTLEQVREKINHQEEKYNWQFTFLGAGPDAFAGGMSMGFKASSSANYSLDNVAVAYASATANVGRMRCATSKGLDVVNEYTDEELKSMS